MKKKLLYILTIGLTLLMICEANAAIDPFAQGSWYRDSYVLKTSYYKGSPPNCRDCHYSIYYTFSGGHARSDYCIKTSATTLDCSPLHASVSYNSAGHSATLTEYSSTYIFYENGYQLQESPLSGTWKATSSKWCSFNAIIIPYAEKNAKEFYPGTEYDNSGSSHLMNLKLTEDDKHTLAFDEGSAWLFYLYDINGKQITDMNNLNTVATMKADVHGNECLVIKSQ
jgi:hypothetical protein